MQSNQSIQLTEPELAFITDLTISYKNRRLAALKKATRRSQSADLEILSINSLVNKLEALHSLALEASPQTIVNDLPHPFDTAIANTTNEQWDKLASEARYEIESGAIPLPESLG